MPSFSTQPDPDSMVSAATLAEWLGVTPHTIHKATKDGIIPKQARGAFPLRESIRAYCQHAAATAGGRAVASNNPTLTAERTRWTKEKADQAALLSAKLRGDLISAAEVTSDWAAVLSGVRSRVLAIPARVQQRIGGLASAVVTAIADECRDALTELSDEEKWEL